MDQRLDRDMLMMVQYLKDESANAKPPVRIEPHKDLHIRIRPENAARLYVELTPDVTGSGLMSDNGPTWRGLQIVVTREHVPVDGLFVARTPNGKGGGVEVQGDTIRLTEHWKTEYLPVDLPPTEQLAT